MNSKSSNRINVKKPVYAILVSDTDDSVSYGEVKSLGEAMQVQLTPTVATGVLHGDGQKVEDIALLTGLALAIDITKLKIEVRAEILGNTYQDGVLQEGVQDEAPYIAVGYIVEQTGGASELIWLLKGKAQPLNSSIQQRTESINFSTDSITINFIPRKNDGLFKFFADTANPSFTEGQAQKFFLQGPEKYPRAEG